ncbi:mobile mystery protein A [Knoellia sp. S7-12]|uniref:mobile mystery protein A n=1 Tax=Knoellia sp. S7-12 TaxID=3126698 RepID=UPI0033672938
MGLDRLRDQTRARAALDERFEAWRQLPAQGRRPFGGWIRAIREALGMRAEDLATRMGVSQSSLTRLEKSERAGTIGLDALTRAADALDCDLVYALVPRRPLHEIVGDQARHRALQRVNRVAHTMALEDQALGGAKLEARVKMMTDLYLQSPGLWNEGDDTNAPPSSS